MKILILIILLVLVIISSNYLLQIKIEHFYENILPEYEQEQNNELIEISENVDNIDNTISDVYGISNDAVLQTDDAVKQVEEIRNDISDKMIDINKKYNKMVAKELEETKKNNANTNRNNHILVFYEHPNYGGRRSVYTIPKRGLRYVNLCPRRRRCHPLNDRWSSVRVPRHTLLEVWEHRFRGRYGKIRGNIPNLHRHRFGDNITSFRVRKTKYDVITPTNPF